MALGDGNTWDETTPTNATVATSIDDYNRDTRKGVRSRMALEHEWPASQSATSEGGKHKFITLQQQAAAPTIAGTQTASVYIDTNDTLQFGVGAGSTPIGGGSHMIPRGFELVYASTTTADVNPGTMYHGQGLINTTSATTLTLATAGDWWDGAADSYSGGAGWCYIGVDNSGNIKLLGANPPDKADTAGNTAGTLLYWYDGTLYWRVVGFIRVHTDDTVLYKFRQEGYWLFQESAAVTLTKAASWATRSLAAVVPGISQFVIAEMTYSTGGVATSYYFRRTGGTAAFHRHTSTTDAYDQAHLELDSSQQLDMYNTPANYDSACTVRGIYIGNLR